MICTDDLSLLIAEEPDEASSDKYTISEVVDNIRNAGIPISLWKKPINTEVGQITLGQKLSELEAKAKEGNLSPDDKADLEQFQLLVSKYKRNLDLIVGYDEKRSSLKIPNHINPENINNLLDKVCSVFSDYKWRRSNISMIIYPKEIPLLKTSLKVSNVSVDALLKSLADQVLTPNKIDLGYAGGMGTEMAWDKMLKRQRNITLDIKNASLDEILCRVCEAIGPDVVWTLIPTEKGATLSLIPLEIGTN